MTETVSWSTLQTYKFTSGRQLALSLSGLNQPAGWDKAPTPILSQCPRDTLKSSHSLHKYTHTHTTSSIFEQFSLSLRQTHTQSITFPCMSSPRLIMTPWVCTCLCVCVCVGGGVVTEAPQHLLTGVSNCIHTYQQGWDDLFIWKDIATLYSTIHNTTQ